MKNNPPQNEISRAADLIREYLEVNNCEYEALRSNPTKQEIIEDVCEEHGISKATVDAAITYAVASSMIGSRRGKYYVNPSNSTDGNLWSSKNTD